VLFLFSRIFESEYFHEAFFRAKENLWELSCLDDIDR